MAIHRNIASTAEASHATGRLGQALQVFLFISQSSGCAWPHVSSKGEPSTIVTIDGASYEIVSCKGVNQRGVPCRIGTARRFVGALVCKLEGDWSEPMPEELCARLPNGCKPYLVSNTTDDTFSVTHIPQLRADFPYVTPCGSDGWAISNRGSVPFAAPQSTALAHELLQTRCKWSAHIVLSETPCCANHQGFSCPQLDLYERLDFSPVELSSAIVLATTSALLNDVSWEVDIKWHRASPPRCAVQDPDCGPLSYQTGCQNGTAYHKNLSRIPIIAVPTDGVCDHDGDCFSNNEAGCLSCGSRFSGLLNEAHCSSPRGAVWKSALCGCIDGHCGYFRQ